MKSVRSLLLSLALLGGCVASRGDGIHPTPTLTATAAEDPAFLADVLARTANSAAASALSRAVELIKLRPENSDHWVRLGDILRQHARDTLDFTLYRPVERCYLRAAGIDPQNQLAFVGLAWATGAGHRFEESLKAARQALVLDPQNAEAYGLIGDAEVEAGAYDDAAEDYAKMLELRPGLAAYSRMGHLLFLQGNSSAAMDWLRKAIHAGGEHPEHVAWCAAELAKILCHEGAAPLALQTLAEPRRRSPDNLALLAAEAHARAATGDEKRAIELLERAVALCPQHETLALLHDLYLAAGRKDDARAVVSRVEDLHRRLEEAYVFGGEGQLARFYADRGENLATAVTLAEREYAHHKTAAAADTLAWTYFRAGRIAETRRLVSGLLRQNVTDATVLYHIALIESAQGRIGAARQHLSAALSREPRFNPMHGAIAQAELDRLAQLPTEDTHVAQKESAAPR